VTYKVIKDLSTRTGKNERIMDDDIPIPSKGYNLNFLDNLDDPNFNPFKTKSSVGNEPMPQDNLLTQNKVTDGDSKKDEIKEERPKKTKKIVRSDTFTKSDVEEVQDVIKKEETPEVPKKREKPKKTILSILMKSQRKMVRSKTMSSIDLDNEHPPESPKTPSLDIDSLLESISISKISEAANVSDFLLVSDEDSITPRRKVSVDRTSASLNPSDISNYCYENFQVLDNDILAGSMNKTTSELLRLEASTGYNTNFLDNLKDPNFDSSKRQITVKNDFSEQDTKCNPNETNLNTNIDDTQNCIIAPYKKLNLQYSMLEEETTLLDSINEDGIESHKVASSYRNNTSALDSLDDPNVDPFKPKNSANNYFGSEETKLNQYRTNSNTNVHETEIHKNDINMNLNMQYSMVEDTETLECLASISSSKSNNELSMANSFDHPEVQKLKTKIAQYKEEIFCLDENENIIKNITNQFKTTISELTMSREKDSVYHDIEKDKITSEKSQIIDNLIGAENSYKDVKGKYDRTKDVIPRYQYDEDNLKKCLKEKSEKLREKEQHFVRLKCHAEDKVNQANEAIMEITNSRAVEIARLTTMLRKSELRVETLEETMKQKSEESRELANMCDELINCAKAKPSYNFSM
jgi:hypothetical protein